MNARARRKTILTAVMMGAVICLAAFPMQALSRDMDVRPDIEGDKIRYRITGDVYSGDRYQFSKPCVLCRKKVFFLWKVRIMKFRKGMLYILGLMCKVAEAARNQLITSMRVHVSTYYTYNDDRNEIINNCYHETIESEKERAKCLFHKECTLVENVDVIIED